MELLWVQQVSLWPTTATSSPSLPSKKQHFFDSATKESVPPPKNQQQKQNNWSNNTCTTPDYSLASSLWQSPERGVAHVSECPLLCGGWGDTHQDTQCSRPMMRNGGTNRGCLKLFTGVDEHCLEMSTRVGADYQYVMIN